MDPSYHLPAESLWPGQHSGEGGLFSFRDPDLVAGDICCLSAQNLFPVSSVNNTPISLMEGFFPTLNGCDGVADLNPLPPPPSPPIQVGETVSHFADIMN